MKKLIFMITLILLLQFHIVYANEFKCWSCDHIYDRAATNNCSSCGWDICSNCGACSYNGCSRLKAIAWEANREERYISLAALFAFYGLPVLYYLSRKFIYNKDGYSKNGYNKEGYDRYGYGKDGYDKDGYDKYGYGKDGYNKDGYDKYGYGKDGYNKDGYDKYGYNIEGYDKYGYGKDGYNKDGVDKYGCGKDGYTKDGYDKYGYDKDGYDKEGYNLIGLKKEDYITLKRFIGNNEKFTFSESQMEYLKQYKSKTISVLYIPEEILDENFCKVIIYINHHSIDFIPKKYVTQELRQLAKCCKQKNIQNRYY